MGREAGSCVLGDVEDILPTTGCLEKQERDIFIRRELCTT